MPQTAPEVRPVSAPERLVTIDILRGFALLGILLINSEFFALPGAVYFDPRAAGGFAGLDLAAWYFTSIFALQKMMGIFSMLFGSGVVILTERVRVAGGPVARIYYRRILWLLVFGMIHGYLVWYGDILYGYAMIGLYLYFFRNRSPRTLLVWALAFLQAVDHFVELRPHILPHFTAHLAHHAPQSLGVVLQPVQCGRITKIRGHVFETAVFRFCDTDPPDLALYIAAVTMRATDL